MSYDFEVTVDWAPADELVVSLMAYLDQPKSGKLMDLGRVWAHDIKLRAARELAEVPAPADTDFVIALLLVWFAPEPRTAEGFIAWLDSLTPAQLYELLSPQIYGVTLDYIIRARDRWLQLLRVWNHVYFRTLDPRILTGLAASAEATRQRLVSMPAADLVEEVTNGVRLEPGDTPRRVVLVPQFHYRPGDIVGHALNVTGHFYPVDVLPTPPGALPSALRWLTHALSDESRLQILRLLSAEPRRFMDIVQESGLAKSTVHHHLLALRAAGLIRAHDSGTSADRYSLRAAHIESLGLRIMDFLRGANDE